MKKIRVPIFQVSLIIYKADERKKFEKVYGEIPDEWYGCQNGEVVFVGDNPAQDKIGTCYHEAIHWVDWVLEHRLSMDVEGLEGHTEIRAYMVQYIGDQIRRYCCE